MGIQCELDALYQEIDNMPDTKYTDKIKIAIENLQDLLDSLCDICGKKQDADGNCGCTNNDTK